VTGYVPGTDRLIRTRRIAWDDEPLDLTADEARLANMPTPGGDGRKARAAPVREFLRGVLEAGRVLQKTAVERGAEQGFSLDQLRRALKALKGRPFKQSKEWFWALPEHVPAGAEKDEQEVEE
jgi:hypothetical protein